MATDDYYQILGVNSDASQAEIKAEYRKLALKYHPDRNRDDPVIAERMKGLNEAYAVLSNPEKRREYDSLRSRFGNTAHDRFRNSYSDQDIFKGADFHSVFEEMSRSFGLRGFDEIFKEVYGPGYRRFEVRRPGFFAKGYFYMGPGRRRRGRSGIHSGGHSPLLRFSRYLLEKAGGLQHPKTGKDLTDRIDIPHTLARTGGPYAYFHRQLGKKLIVKIPPGIRKGQRIRLAGMGVSGRRGGSAGDLYLQVRIRQPLWDKIKRMGAGLFR